MKLDEVIAFLPLFLIGGLGIVGAGALLYQFIAESPIQNGLIILFSIWLVGGCLYLWAKNSAD